MSLSKAALNMAEALRPVLVKLIPQKMLSAVKADVYKRQDFTSFSFHAVKNLTTAEGGGLVWRDIPGVDNDCLLYTSHCRFLARGRY